MRPFLICAFLSMALCLGSCDRRPEDKAAETMWRGSLTVWCDESVAPLLTSQIDAFSKKYPDARIDMRVAAGREVMEALLSRKARIALLARGYLRDEDSLMKAFGVEPHRRLHVATDALVFFTRKGFPSDTLSVEAIHAYLSSGEGLAGRIHGLNDKVRLVCPGPLSSVVGNVVLQCNDGKPFSAKARIAYAGTMDSVKRCVRSDPDAIGVGLLSDMIKDTAAFKLLGIKYTDKDMNRRSMKVEQSAVYREMYPYPVKIEAYLLENLRNLPMGMASFLAFETGPQKYFLDQGIVPAYARIQLIEE
ncbi:MAG: substrate-binding domain-containing protein [Candidatus Kapaibacterium sp.]